MDRDIQNYMSMTGGGRIKPTVNYEQFFRAPQQAQKPKGNPLLKTGASIVGGTLGTVLGTIVAPGAGTAIGGALGSGLGTALGRALGRESVLGQGGLQEIGLDALLGGVFSGAGKAAKAAKLGQTALQIGGKELGMQTAKGLAEGAGVSAGKEALQQTGKITGKQALTAARQAAAAGRPTEIFGKAGQSLQRAAQKELGFQEAAKLGGQKISAQQGDTLYNFLVKDIGLKGTEKISPGKALRAVENAQKSIIGSLEQSVKDSGYIFSKTDAEKLLMNARKNYPLGAIKDSKSLKTLEDNVFNAIKDNTFEGVNKARQMLDRSITFSKSPGSKTPWMEDVADSMRKAIDERLTQISGANKDIKGLYQRTTNARKLLQAAQGKEVAEIGSITQGAMRGLRSGQAMLGSSQGLQKTLQTLSGLNTAGGRIAAGMPTVLSQTGRQTARAAVTGAISGKPTPTEPGMAGMEDMTGMGGMEQGTGMEDITGMAGGMGAEQAGADQQAQIDQYFQGLALQDLQQTGGKRLSSIKAAYDLFGGGKAAKPSAAQIKGEQQNLQVQSSLQQLAGLYEQAGGGSGRIGGAISGLAGTVGANEAAFNYNQYRDSMLAPLARAISGEVGVLTDRDIKRADGLLPKLTDNPREAARKLQLLQNQIQSRQSISQQVYSRGTSGGQSLGDVLYNFPQ
jgi:hypothetical protein